MTSDDAYNVSTAKIGSNDGDQFLESKSLVESSGETDVQRADFTNAAGENEGDECDDDDGEVVKRSRVQRTGDRDIVFDGQLIGTGTSGGILEATYKAYIYKTEGGKFVASRSESVDLRTNYSARVCDAVATVAEFFYVESVPTLTRGAKRATQYDVLV